MISPSRVRVPGLLGLLFGLACSDSSALFVPLPPADVEGSIVLALSEVATERFIAFDVGDGATPAPFPEGIEVIEAYVYEQDLAALRIPAGALTFEMDGQRLPAPSARQVLSFETEPPAWTAAAMTPELDAFRTELVSPCFEMEVERTTLTPGLPLFVEPLPDGSLLHGLRTTETQVLELNRIRADRQVEGLGIIEDANITAGAIAGGRLWLGDASGGIRVAPLDDPTNTSTHSRTPSGEIIRRMLVESDPETTSLIITTLAGGGTVERFDGANWRTVRAAAPSDNEDGDMIRLADGAYLFGVPLFDYVLHERDGVVNEETVDGSGGPVALGVVGGEPMVGLTSGEVFVRRGAAWIRLGDPPAAVEVYTFLEFGDGFFISGTSGYFAEWNRELGTFCPPVTFEGYSSIGYLHHVGDHIVVAGNPARNRYPTPIDFLRPRSLVATGR